MNVPHDMVVYFYLYVWTWVAHVALIGYVLTGTAWLAVRGLLRVDDDAIAAQFRDRLPFMLGAAITAGVAPLLFVQILYQERFYTANLLLSHRWMAVVPALIVGFYALYAAKAWPARWRAAVPAIATTCFVFVAYSWTENHLLAMRPDRWAPMYGAGSMIHVEAGLAPRVLLWLALAVPVGATIAAFMLRDDAAAVRRLRVAAFAGLAVAIPAAIWMVSGWQRVPDEHRRLAWMMLGAAGMPAAILVGCWLVLPGTKRKRLVAAIALAALVAMLVDVAVVRECYRLHVLAAARPRVAAAGGMALFFIVFAVNAGLIAWLIRGARRALLPPR